MPQSDASVSRASPTEARHALSSEGLPVADHDLTGADLTEDPIPGDPPRKHPAADLAAQTGTTGAPVATEPDTPPRLSICVVVPAFNEAGSVARVVARVNTAVPEAHVVVVNDGSRDDTGLRAQRAGATVVNLPVNLGIGGAVQAGYRYAMQHGFDIAIQVDGDDQHDPFEIQRLLSPIVEGRADMTVGSRWLGRGEYVATTGRRFGMRVLAKLVRWRTGHSFTDTTSGFRAVGKSGIELFARTYPIDFPEVESLVLASRHGLRVQEVPAQMTPRSHGRSSIAGLRSAYYMARVIVALLVGSLNPADDTEKKEIR